MQLGKSRMSRLPIVGVMGSGKDPQKPRAEHVGRWLAGEGVHLLTGGGAGVMESVSRSFFQEKKRKGLVIDFLLEASFRYKRLYYLNGVSTLSQ